MVRMGLVDGVAAAEEVCMTHMLDQGCAAEGKSARHLEPPVDAESHQHYQWL